jgi:hypothetical protein
MQGKNRQKLRTIRRRTTPAAQSITTSTKATCLPSNVFIGGGELPVVSEVEPLWPFYHSKTTLLSLKLLLNRGKYE